ncbi:uncharacterized protein LOC123535464 [Mercenaria mercenaria]|uniref:uncharacterized protein LOC123535464 n=1 Tax=Mercenaria mercenaria TaxID=6596 RepID=UPI00234E69DA|nr:uncharacterized protein LOC123535464 [Mercenaria mercenaria]
MSEVAQKPDDYQNVFKSFKTHKSTVCNALDYLNSSETANFCFVKIEDCNAEYSCGFTECWCPTKRNLEEEDHEKRKLVYYGEVFEIELLKSFLEGKETLDSLGYGRIKALEKLSDFLCDSNLQETSKILAKPLGKDLKEAKWASLVATHIFSKLAVTSDMTISDMGYQIRYDQCPCGCLAPLRVGDTSIGNENVWHGSVDILMGHVAGITRAEESVGENTEEDDSSFETNPGNLEFGRDQLIAKCVVFSCVQNIQGYKLGLAPTIVISKDRVKVYMYDPKSDMLYESTELPLFSPYVKKLNTITIVALWLAVNYAIFGTGVQPAHQEFGYTADFKDRINNMEKNEIYKTELQIGGCKQVRRLKPNHRGGFGTSFIKN